jgi:hypothetical protein
MPYGDGAQSYLGGDLFSGSTDMADTTDAPMVGDALAGGAFWLPKPFGWKRALRLDFTTGITSLPSALNSWANGVPSGTTYCGWTAANMHYSSAGITFFTDWGAYPNTQNRVPTNPDGSGSASSGWRCGGFGTKAQFFAPCRVRVYERLLDLNIDGLNKVSQMMPRNWSDVEIDFDECGVKAGVLQQSYIRMHDGTTNGQDHLPGNPNYTATIVGPMQRRTYQTFGRHCYEVELDNQTVTSFTDGRMDGSLKIPNAAGTDSGIWDRLCDVPRPIICQTQMYNAGLTGDHGKTSQRTIAGIEVFVKPRITPPGIPFLLGNPSNVDSYGRPLSP